MHGAGFWYLSPSRISFIAFLFHWCMTMLPVLACGLKAKKLGLPSSLSFSPGEGGVSFPTCTPGSRQCFCFKREYLFLLLLFLSLPILFLPVVWLGFFHCGSVLLSETATISYKASAFKSGKKNRRRKPRIVPSSPASWQLPFPPAVRCVQSWGSLPLPPSDKACRASMLSPQTAVYTSAWQSLVQAFPFGLSPLA